MDLRFTDEENAFRSEVRNFFRTEIPAETRRKYGEGEEVSRDEMVTSQRILNAKGWATPRWPLEWGGQPWTPIQHHIFLEELQFNSVPQPLQFNVDMVGPVIAAFGSEEQKRHFLPRAANLDDWWCQGFSEPGAGSDLASLKTRARARRRPLHRQRPEDLDDGSAQHADWIFCLVRTDPEAKKQMGISFLLIDMATPGVVVRPIITIDGRHEVNEVFLDDVKVPVEQLRRRGEPGLGLCQIPARQRAHRHRPRRHDEAAPRAHQGDRQADTRRRKAAWGHSLPVASVMLPKSS